MSEMKQRSPSQSQGTGLANNTALSTAAPKAKAKAKKGKDGNTLVPNGGQVINPASSSAPVKAKKLNNDNDVPVMPKKG